MGAGCNVGVGIVDGFGVALGVGLAVCLATAGVIVCDTGDGWTSASAYVTLNFAVIANKATNAVNLNSAHLTCLLTRYIMPTPITTGKNISPRMALFLFIVIVPNKPASTLLDKLLLLLVARIEF